MLRISLWIGHRTGMGKVQERPFAGIPRNFARNGKNRSGQDGKGRESWKGIVEGNLRQGLRDYWKQLLEGNTKGVLSQDGTLRTDTRTSGKRTSSKRTSSKKGKRTVL